MPQPAARAAPAESGLIEPGTVALAAPLPSVVGRRRLAPSTRSGVVSDAGLTGRADPTAFVPEPEDSEDFAPAGVALEDVALDGEVPEVAALGGVAPEVVALDGEVPAVVALGVDAPDGESPDVEGPAAEVRDADPLVPGAGAPEVGEPEAGRPEVGASKMGPPGEPGTRAPEVGAPPAVDVPEREAPGAEAAEALVVSGVVCLVAQRAPGAGGGGGAYPSWSPAGVRAAGGFMPSLSGVACRSSMDPPDRRVPTDSVVGRCT